MFLGIVFVAALVAYAVGVIAWIMGAGGLVVFALLMATGFVTTAGLSGFVFLRTVLRDTDRPGQASVVR